MIDAIVAAVLAFLGAILAAVITKYGLYGCRWRRRRSPSIGDEEQSTAERANLLDTSPQEIIKKMGPWGYPGKGDAFDHRDFDGIKSIEIYSSAAIDCIRVQYTRRGNLIWTPRVGANTSTVVIPNQKLVLEDDEYITDIVGYYGSYCGEETLIGLKFYTNRNRNPNVWGRDYAESGELDPIRFVASRGKIVGFHGTAGKYIFSIGLYVSTSEWQQTPATPSAVKGVYWFPYAGIDVADIDATLYTHVFCASADLNRNTNQVTISDGNAYISNFTSILQRRNPSISTILSIGRGHSKTEDFSAMASKYTSRQSFINSSIELARTNNFFGLDINWQYPEGTFDMANYATLLTELRTAVNNEAFSSGRTPLLLTAALYFSAKREQTRGGEDTFPINSINTNLNWINLMNYDYHGPSWEPKFTSAPAALKDKNNQFSTNTGIDCWIRLGLPPSKIALGLPFYGRAWKLVNSNNNGIGEAANGMAVGNGIDRKGAIIYKDIINFIKCNNAITKFDSSFVTDYCYAETTWIGYDDVESVKAKILFAKDRGLLGYFAWAVDGDHKFVLSRTAYNAWEERDLCL